MKWTKVCKRSQKLYAANKMENGSIYQRIYLACTDIINACPSSCKNIPVWRISILVFSIVLRISLIKRKKTLLTLLAFGSYLLTKVFLHWFSFYQNPQRLHSTFQGLCYSLSPRKNTNDFSWVHLGSWRIRNFLNIQFDELKKQELRGETSNQNKDLKYP